MKKLLLYLTFFIGIDHALEARGGGGFHGGGGSHMSGGRSGSRGGGSRNGGSRNGGSRSSSSNRSGNRNGNRSGNTYNHTNNFYGGHGYGYGGWGAWGAFGFTALATTGVVLAASSSGKNNSAEVQKTLMETQIEMQQLQQRLDALENQQDQAPDRSSTEQSPFNDPKAIKAYMDQLKKAQIDLKNAQAQQAPAKSEVSENEDTDLDANQVASTNSEQKEKKIETLQDRLNALKAQLYDYWYGTDNNN